jgi:TM2 domain-containing membrane protein YozV
MTSAFPGPALPQPQPPLPPPSPFPAPPAPPKSPWLALVLSIFPGVGQIYNGQPAKGIVFFFAWVSSIYGAAEISPFPFALLIPFVYFYNLIDAWKSAARINARALGGQPVPEEDEDAFESPVWGGALVGLGLLLLFNNLGWFNLRALERFWPVLMIVAGGIFLYGAVQRRKAGPRTPQVELGSARADELDRRAD